MGKLRRNESLTAYLFILPNFLSLVLFILAPLMYSLVITTFDFNLFKGFSGSEFVGLENFKAVLSDKTFMMALKNNLVYTIVVIPISLTLALLLAIIANDKIFFRDGIRAMYFLPYITSVASVSIVWLMFLNPEWGVINNFLRTIGIDNPPGWLTSTKWALPGVMLMAIWNTLGYNMVVYMAGLQSIDKELYEAAAIDGANSIQRFFKIQIPLLSPTTFFLLITSIISSLQVFGSINVMTEGGPANATMVAAYYIYLTGFRFYKMGYASSLAWCMMLIILAITVVQWIGQKKWVNYQ